MTTRLFWACWLALPLPLLAANNQILGWNNLGMHCMDSDYSVFSILPPYNTIEAQLIVGGRLVTNGAGYTVTYQAVADPAGSFNSTAMGKGNYYNNAQAIYGAVLAPEGGLAGWNMPGVSNTPQAMLFEVTNLPSPVAHPLVQTKVNWWRAEGIPISPYDDAHLKNPYPMMRLIAKAGTTPVATNDIVLPVSDEMDCRACHASGTQAAARPDAGWVWDGIQERDFRLNILRLHDEKNFASNAVLYAAALAARGLNPQGLYRGVVADQKPVLCAACHDSEALGTGSYGNIPPLTASLHAYHAHVIDPLSNLTLDSSANRSACYRCHPGSTTKCLRGAMGGAIAADGSMAMQCQSCHGNMSAVGSASRVGWFMEPNCAGCHTGTATSNNGQIRYTSVFTDTNGTVRVPVNQTFSTQPNIPATGLSLFRFSAGHGGLQCEACHGSTHAEFPSTHVNDNVRNLEIQGHAGVTVECTACHAMPASTSANITAGPHGMHPISQDWVNNHHDLVSYPTTTSQCQVCHGTDYRGTVLSRAQADRSWSAFGGSITFARGAQIGCYNCHAGPSEGDPNPGTAPTAGNIATNTTNDKSVVMILRATGSGLTLRIVSQPANGAVGLNGTVATYFPNPGFVGNDTFTFMAFDGSKNSTPATGSITVAQGPYSLGLAAHVPTNAPAGWPVAFAVVPTVTNNSSTVTFSWNFGDGSALSTNQFAQHTFATPGVCSWQVVAAVGTAKATNSGSILISGPVALAAAAPQNSALNLSWPSTVPDVVLEQSAMLGSGAQWTTVTNIPVAGPNHSSVNVPVADGNRFFRLRQPW